MATGYPGSGKQQKMFPSRQGHSSLRRYLLHFPNHRSAYPLHHPPIHLAHLLEVEQGRSHSDHLLLSAHTVALGENAEYAGNMLGDARCYSGVLPGHTCVVAHPVWGTGNPCRLAHFACPFPVEQDVDWVMELYMYGVVPGVPFVQVREGDGVAGAEVATGLRGATSV